MKERNIAGWGENVKDSVETEETLTNIAGWGENAKDSVETEETLTSSLLQPTVNMDTQTMLELYPPDLGTG